MLTYIKHNLTLERPDLFKPSKTKEFKERIVEILSDEEELISDEK